MTNMINGTAACDNTQEPNEHNKCLLYKIGYIELSSYCIGLGSLIADMVVLNDAGKIYKVSLAINSLVLGLGLVLEDIKEIDRKLSTG